MPMRGGTVPCFGWSMIFCGCGTRFPYTFYRSQRFRVCFSEASPTHAPCDTSLVGELTRPAVHSHTAEVPQFGLSRDGESEQVTVRGPTWGTAAP